MTIADADTDADGPAWPPWRSPICAPRVFSVSVSFLQGVFFSVGKKVSLGRLLLTQQCELQNLGGRTMKRNRTHHMVEEATRNMVETMLVSVVSLAGLHYPKFDQ